MITETNLPGPNTRTKAEALQDDHPIYRHLLAAAAITQWPAAWTDDLYVHDRQQVKEETKSDYIYILRECGTHLFPVVADSSGAAHYARTVCRYWSGTHKSNWSDDTIAHFFRVNAHCFRPITADEAVAAFKVAENK